MCIAWSLCRGYSCSATRDSWLGTKKHASGPTTSKVEVWSRHSCERIQCRRLCLGVLPLCTLKGIAKVDESLAWTLQSCPCITGWPGLYPRLRTRSALRAAKASSWWNYKVCCASRGEWRSGRWNGPWAQALCWRDPWWLLATFLSRRRTALWSMKCIFPIKETQLDGHEATH